MGVCILVTHGGGRLVSTKFSMTCACFLLCPYLLEEVHTGWSRAMRKCGQRGGLTICLGNVLRHPPPWSRGGPLCRHLPARRGLTTHRFLGARVCSLPCGLIPVPQYNPAGCGGYKASALCRPPGHCHSRARWRPLRSYVRDAG